jgi:hypothetical protein
MIRTLSFGLWLSSVLFSQSIHLTNSSINSLPVPPFPFLLQIARAEGIVNLELEVKDGKVMSTRAMDWVDEKNRRQYGIQTHAIEYAKQINFNTSTTGRCLLQIRYHTVHKEHAELKGHPRYFRVSIEPYENAIEIEFNAAESID